MQLNHSILSDFSHLFYPHLCTGCGSDLLSAENLLCIKCYSQLPKTNYAQHAGNPIEKKFWGRLPLKAAHAEFYFAKETLVQQLIHQLKYKSNKAIGKYLGELMAASLLESNRFQNIDALVPLPLFAKKERKRGYNQAAIICEGMSTMMNVPVYNNLLVRQRFTETQTKKHREERWENVEGSFSLNKETVLEGKNILLVDDVVTTGATFEAAGMALLKVKNTSLSIAALAYASS